MLRRGRQRNLSNNKLRSDSERIKENSWRIL